MSNVGRIILDGYCNGFAGRRFDLAESIIEYEASDYIILRTLKGEPVFIGFFTYENGEIYKNGFHFKDKQKMIDEWCFKN